MVNFKRFIVLLIAVALIFVMVGCEGQGGSEGHGLYEEAQAMQEEMELTEAAKLYRKAMPLLIKDGQAEEANDCKLNLQTIKAYEDTYPYSEDEIVKLLAENLPDVSEKESKEWIENGELEHMAIDGETRYFAQAADNIAFRHIEIMKNSDKAQEVYAGLINPFIEDIVLVPPVKSWQPFEKPISYLGTGVLAIPGKELPDTGVLKLWFPVPILTGPQDTVEVVAISPDTYVKQPPSIDQDIGLVYMEVPLKSLAGDLNIQIQFSFTHYQQRFTIDPENVGSYDKDSAEYKEYTKSYGNTYISPEIKETSRQIVGNEKNPYKAAHKIYDYVLKDIKYSFMPHGIMWPRSDQRESVYVHEMKRGDCGAQSMYFSALCRAEGIPARTTGGWQLLSGQFSDHFWAEFMLPNYGWIPVDPTVAEMGDYLKDITEENRKAFKDFFFGNMDATRCVVQKDVDEPLIPPAQEMVLLPLAIQEPAALCDTMEGMPGELVDKYWTLEAQIVSQ